MSILIVDDIENIRRLLKLALKKGDLEDVKEASCAKEAYQILGIEGKGNSGEKVDLILMDIMMPEINGIDACRRIKSIDSFKDVPIIMITAQIDDESLTEAFEAGAFDYIKKPFNQAELLSRVKSALSLKGEAESRKEREEDLKRVKRQLEDANRSLERKIFLDKVTGVPSRPHFDDFFEREFGICLREKRSLSLLLVEIDYFKALTDKYGYEAGDEALIKVADLLKNSLNRAGDFVARYKGHQFTVLLFGPSSEYSGKYGEKIGKMVGDLKIPNSLSKSSKYLSVSIGGVTATPNGSITPYAMFKEADKALLRASQAGGNRAELVTK